MAENQANQKAGSINFIVDPNKTKVLYVDSYVISNNEHVVVFTFGQALPNPAQHNVVARLALTKAQAREFVKNLNDHLERFEV